MPSSLRDRPTTGRVNRKNTALLIHLGTRMFSVAAREERKGYTKLAKSSPSLAHAFERLARLAVCASAGRVPRTVGFGARVVGPAAAAGGAAPVTPAGVSCHLASSTRAGSGSRRPVPAVGSSGWRRQARRHRSRPCASQFRLVVVSHFAVGPGRRS